MKIEVNLEKKYFLGILVFGFLIIGLVAVYAYNSNGNPANFGHSSDEIAVMVGGNSVSLVDFINGSIDKRIASLSAEQFNITDENGGSITLVQYIQNKIDDAILGASVVDCLLIYDSMVGATLTEQIKYRESSANNYFVAKSVPSVCFSTLGCIIKQEIYTSKGLYLTRQSSYSQSESTGLWWSTYKNTGQYINGLDSPTGTTATSTDVISAYGYLLLRDDYYSSTYKIDRDSSQWAFRDYDTTRGMKVYVCAVSSNV